MKLGAGDVFLGVLSCAVTAPFLCSVFSMSAIERKGKRRVLLPWLLVSTSCVLLFLPLPIAARRVPATFCLVYLLLVVLLRSGTVALSNTAWFPLIQDIVPARLTGRYFARLRTSWQASSLVVVLAVAWLLSSDSGWWGFELIFVAAFVLLAGRLLMVTLIKEKPHASLDIRQTTITARIREVFSHRQLRLFMIYICCYTFLALALEPFKIKMLKELGYGSGLVLAGTSMVGVGAIISLRFWGKLADGFGNRAIFSISHIGMIATTVLWIVVGRGFFSGVMLFVLYLSYGIFHSANGIAQTRYLLHAVPDTKQNYINRINLSMYATRSLAPLFSGIFLALTENVTFSSGALRLNNYYILFITVGTLFTVPHILRRKLRHVKEKPTSEVVAFVMRPLRNVFGPFRRIAKR